MNSYTAFIDSRDLVFDDKVREQCKSCKRYGDKATCPPHVEDVSYYRNLLPKYKRCIIYYKKFTVSKKIPWHKQGKISSLLLNGYIFEERNRLIMKGHPFTIAFGGGSCKLCDACSFPCRTPNMSLIPFEATGINIKATMKKVGIDIRFPVKKHFYRVGAIFYD